MTPHALVTDAHDPQYYLQQIPKTEQELHLSDSLIADALYNLIYIYGVQVQDLSLARETTEELHRRFPDDARLVEVYYEQYLHALRDSDDTQAALARSRILSEYPESKQAEIVSDPTYFERLRHMAVEQDSLYEQTYIAFSNNDFATVKSNKAYAEQQYPFSNLMPRFLFLNAVAVARSESQDAFIVELKDMVARYPDNELSAMAKDFLAMMGQGYESQTGALESGLNDLRSQQEDEEETAQQQEGFSTDTKTSSLVFIILPTADEQVLNQLLYQVALFNFSQFMIRDFDLRQMPIFFETSALRVSGFENYEEALWWMGMTENNADLKNYLIGIGASLLPITEDNAKLFNSGFTLDEYKAFLQENDL